MYEYKFVEIPVHAGGLRAKTGDAFEKCKEAINDEAANGWRLKQVVLPANEKTGLYSTYCYQIIFEKEIENFDV